MLIIITQRVFEIYIPGPTPEILFHVSRYQMSHLIMPMVLDYTLRNIIAEIRLKIIVPFGQKMQNKEMLYQINKLWKSQSHFVKLIPVGFQVFYW